MLKLTPEAIKFILLQRTQLKEGVTAEEIEADFRRDFDTYKDFLPDFTDDHEQINVVDIGSGIGIQNILLQEAYSGIVNITMIDKTQTEDNIWYGFKDEGAFYNSLDLSVDTLLANGVHSLAQFATDDNEILLADESVDLVTSLISWGFHYPIETYLNEAIRVMKPGATLILDVRKGTGGIAALTKVGAEVFTRLKVIKDFEKYQRIICVKKEA